MAPLASASRLVGRHAQCRQLPHDVGEEISVELRSAGVSYSYHFPAIVAHGNALALTLW